jgi:invasion protein IalB
MDHRLVFAPARPAACAFAAAAAAGLLTALINFGALAQTPPAPPAPPAPKAQPAPKAKDKAAPKATQKGPETPAAQPQQSSSIPPLIYSPWTKFCVKNQETGAKQVCLTGKDGRLEDGRSVVSAVLIEAEGETKRALRVMLPIGVALRPGSRVFVDEGQPMNGPYELCQPVGCFSEYEASTELIGKLKKGQNLVLQAMQPNNQAITLVVPLADFAKAYEGPPIDPQVFEQQQKKLQDELQRRAEEARKKLEGQPKQ